MIGTLASVIGLIYGIAATEHRHVLGYANPSRTIIYRSTGAENLKVAANGVAIQTDISSFQVAIWNAGAKSARNEHLLTPVVITTGEVPILSARIRYESRAVVKAHLDLTKMAVGEVRVSWQILEQDDGAIIEIIYAGNTIVPVKVSAAIEGQQDLAVSSPVPDRPVWVFLRSSVPMSYAGMAFIGMGATVLASIILVHIAAYKRRHKRHRLLDAWWEGILTRLNDSTEPDPPFVTARASVNRSLRILLAVGLLYTLVPICTGIYLLWVSPDIPPFPF